MFYKNRYMIVIILVLAMMVGGYVLGVRIGEGRLEENMKNNDEDQSFETMQTTRKSYREITDQEMPAIDITTKNTLMVFKTYYTKCKDERIEERRAEDSEIGLNRQEIKAKFPDWEVREFSSPQVILTKELNEYCPNHFILKAKDGIVVIYLPSDEENTERNIEKTRISINNLPSHVQEEIRKGLVLDSLEEVEYFMESLDS